LTRARVEMGHTVTLVLCAGKACWGGRQPDLPVRDVRSLRGILRVGASAWADIGDGRLLDNGMIRGILCSLGRWALLRDAHQVSVAPSRARREAGRVVVAW